MDVGGYLGRSLNLTMKYPVPIIVGALVAGAVGAATLGILAAPAYAGVAMLYVAAAAGREPEVGRVFAYLNRTGRLFGAAFVMAVLTGIGFCLLIVPGLLMLAWWSYVPLLIADRGLGIGEAMRRSREMVRADGVGAHLVFLLVLAVIGSLGGALAGIGLLLSMPVAGGALALAYADRRDR